MEKGHLESALQTDVCFLVCMVGVGVLVFISEGHPEPGGSCRPHPPGLGLHQIWHCRKTSVFSHPHPKDKSVPHRIRHLVQDSVLVFLNLLPALTHFLILVIGLPTLLGWWIWMKMWLIGERLCPWRAPLFWKDVSSLPHFYGYKYFFLLIDL